MPVTLTKGLYKYTYIQKEPNLSSSKNHSWNGDREYLLSYAGTNIPNINIKPSKFL